jgi:peptidoglycan/LPS O-acetylase OafA/YrhL
LVTVACLFLQFPFERNAVTLCIPLLVYLAAQDTSLLTRALAGKVFNWLGDISYSIYVWHWPVLFVLARGLAGARNLRIVQVAHLDSPFFYIITTFGLVLLLAHCSHYYFERPVSTWLRKKRLFAVAPTMA